MMCHLCNDEVHNVEPFFLTWDKSFIKFRQECLQRFKRNSPLSFHLFNPAKFINHFSLMRLKINPQAITSDFLSIMESQNLYDKTQTLWDAVNKFLNIDTISAQKRRRYIVIIKNLFETELDYSSQDIEDLEKTSRVAHSFEDIVSRVNEYFNGESIHSITDYRSLMLSEEYFDKFSKLIFDTLNNKDLDNNFLQKIDTMISTFIAEQAASLKS